MRKLLKLIIGVISSIILLMYLTLPFVKIGDDIIIIDNIN